MKRIRILSRPEAAGCLLLMLLLFNSFGLSAGTKAKPGRSRADATAEALESIAKREVGRRDWPMWGGWPSRNNTPQGENIPDDWDVISGKNLRWEAKLGSQTYGTPVVAGGRVYIGTNNSAAYVDRYPSDVDLCVLLCFDEQSGKFLWQYSSPKLATGRVHDWPHQGLCSTPFVDGERLWFVSNRGEILCLDTAGFRDGENNGPFQDEPNENRDEADVIWRYDMMAELGTRQHNMCSCSVLCAGDILLVNTSNGVNETHIVLPAPDAPSFVALDRNTGKLLWTDASPGRNITSGQWSSPAYVEVGGRAQVIFGGGDGWLYSFDPKGDGKGGSKLWWKFDCNPKDSRWVLGGRGNRNHLVATPVVYKGRVYIATGQSPDFGEGEGCLWCIDPTKEGDVSPTLAVGKDGKPIAIRNGERRSQYVFPENGEKIVANPNSAAVWHTASWGKDFEQQMHRSCCNVVIKDDILYIADFSGLFHCLDARTGKPHWTYDMFAAAWGSPLIVEGKVYIGDEDGDIAIFELSTEQKMIREVNMNNSVYSTPVVANNVLYIANKNTLYAISADK